MSFGQENTTVQPYYPVSFPAPPAFIPTTTETKGRSWGGSQTTIHTEYEEHTVTEGQAFTTGNNWSTAWTTDTVHAADLRFSYRVSNSGADYSREVEQIVFNLYLGEDETPFHTCSLDGPNDCDLVNFFNMEAGESHQATAGPIPLTLDEMRRVDLGEPVYVVVEDYSYGIDEYFYNDAMSSGVLFAFEDGTGDDDELIDTYLLPSWGTETVQDVLQRYFPSTEDGEGNLLSIWTPEFAPFGLEEHALTNTSWWNIYMAGLGDGSEAFKDILSPPVPHDPSEPQPVVLFRFNQDTDRDGYGDRSEIKLGTDPDGPADHPTPELLAGAATTCDGSDPGAVCTTLLSFLNTGNYDAYGVEAVMYAPDDTTTIGNNTIGGGGRVRAFSQVVLGTRVMPPAGVGDTWTGSAIPYSGGYYAGDQDKVFTFAASGSGNVGSGTLTLNWTDQATKASGTLDIGSSYHAPLPLEVAQGLQIGFDTGTIMAGNTFTVGVRLPRDTFTYTIESGSYTPPAIVVSYNDPQGNHRFATPITHTSPVSDLLPYSGQMLEGVELEITTLEPFDPAVTNTHYLVVNSPHPAAIQDGHLFMEYVDITGTVVAEQVFTTTLQPGPTAFPVEWSTGIFTAPFTTAEDYNLLAFWTDAQGNIIDSAARPLATFQADPLAKVAASGTSWDFGTVTQGMTPETTLALANTGLVPLRAYADSRSADGLTLAGGRSLMVPPGEFRTLDLTLDTAAVPIGSYNATLTLPTSDPDNPTVAIQVTGKVEELTEDALAYPVGPYRPWNQYVYVPGPHDANDVVTFTHTVAGDPGRVHPLYVYSQDSMLLGVGEFGLNLAGESTSFGVFGNGADGDLVIENGQEGYVDTERSTVASTAIAGQRTVPVVNSEVFNAGDEVLIIQMQGIGVGTFEFRIVQSAGSNTLTLTQNLTNTYNVDDDSVAQVIRVPHYRNVSVESGGTLKVHRWNGSIDGVFAIRVSGSLNIQGELGAAGAGYQGGTRATSPGAPNNEYRPAYRGENEFEGVDQSNSPNAVGMGGGAGVGDNSGGKGGGGGGGTGSSGSQGGDNGGQGGYTGIDDLTLQLLLVGGGGGGGGADTDDNTTDNGGFGGKGGGIVFIGARNLTISDSGKILAYGLDGGDWGYFEQGSSAGGGGGGGSVKIRAFAADIQINRIDVHGGIGGNGGGAGTNGGNGGVGRIRIEYCDTLIGSTSPPASTEPIECFIARQVPDSLDIELVLPAAITNRARYHLQYGLRSTHTLSITSNLLNVTIPNQGYTAATLDVLLLNTDTPTYTLTLDVGDDGSADWTESGVFTGPVLLNSPDLAAAFNAALGRAVGGEMVVPISVTLDTAGDLFLTNLILTPGPAGDAEVTAAGIGFSNLNPTEGDTVTVQATISNTQSLTAAHIMAAFFAGDPEADGIYLGADFLPAIPPGGTATAGLDWDTEGFGGDVELYVVLDPAGQVNETDEDNNSAFQPIHVKSRADLQVINLTTSEFYPRNGRPVTVTAVISNAGETDSGSYTVAFTDDGVEFDTVTLTTGGEMTGTVSVVWTPAGMGDHTLTAVADNDDVVVESNEVNNQTSQPVFVALYDQLYADSGGAPDPAYDPITGYGWLSGTLTGTWGTIVSVVRNAISTPEQSYRWNPAGPVRYQFDYLAPDGDYHVDVTLLDGSDEGIHGTETLWVDGFNQGSKDLSDRQVHWLSVRPDAALYSSDHSLLVDVTADGFGGAVVSEIAVREIDYRYLDCGPDPAGDPPYSSELGYGYLNGYGSNAWGDTPAETFRWVPTDTVRYRFDGLDPARNYQVNLTLYDRDDTGRQQTVVFDGIESGVILVPGPVPTTTAMPVPMTAYSLDGSVVVSVRRTNGNFPIVNVLELEERTVPWEGDDDWQGPAISDVVYPVSAVSGQAMTVTAEISDATTGNNGVSGAWLDYGYVDPGYNEFTVVGSAPAGGTGDGNWTFLISAQGADSEGGTLRFSIRAVDGDDIPEATTDNNSGAYYSIGIDDDDTTGPAIGTPSYPSSAASDQPFEVTVDISDAAAGGHGVVSATLHYGYAAPYDQNTVPGAGPGGNGDGTWTFSVSTQGSGREGQTLSFWLEAADGDNTPAANTAPGPYQVRIVNPDDVTYYLYLPLIVRKD